MIKAGASKDHAEQLADVLVAADLRGHYSHGLNRLGKSTKPFLRFLNNERISQLIVV